MAQDTNGVSRREFLQTGAALGASTTAAASMEIRQSSASGFSPASGPRRISEHLFVLEDTCNVYVIRDGSSGLAIDFGSGAILRHLPELGISSLDWILHTHHHRDQAQGDGLAVQQRIPIAVPVHEREYFEDVERFWQNRRIFELYYVRNDFFSLTTNVPVAAVLQDYETFRWKGYDFFIQPTPGHTPGSITLITTVDTKKVAFSGDLMQSPGKVQTLYDLQYFYGEHEGADLSAYSLTELKKHQIEALCPSHGEVMNNPEPGVQDLIEKLSGWFEYWKSWSGSLGNKGRQLTPHVIAHYQTMSSFYTVISESGKALLIDYGLPGWNAFYTFRDSTTTHDRLRFLEHSIDEMRAQYGLKSVEVAIPTHMHDDHLAGFPYLSRRYGTKLWIFENFADIVSNPKGRNLGCTLGEALRVDRVIRQR
ncbi:MAG: MBL fold metallo-hydrolase, partial [Acidobacteriaceae bacterium]|nr:MBL fold metallo-hydrolase [Acidobacteriaceae bacterium]